MLKKGFLLAETIIVITILLWCASASVYYTKTLLDSVLLLQVKLVAQTLDSLQLVAAAHNKHSSFTCSTRQLTCWRGNTVLSKMSLIPFVVFGLRPGDKGSILGPPGKPKKPITEATTFRNNRVRISSFGEFSPGTIYLSSYLSSQVYAVSLNKGHFVRSKMYIYDRATTRWHHISGG